MRTVHPSDQMRQVRRQLESGFSVAEVAREHRIHANTVGRWKRGDCAAFGGAVGLKPWRPPHDGVYAYLLGMYLGDGHLTVRNGRVSNLRIFLDGAYPEIVKECEAAMGITSLGRTVNVMRARASNVRILQCCWKRWPEAFPQHGPGRKHERAIVLEGWQQAIADAHPDELVRGLIHSDGCRTVNRFSTTLPSGRVATYEYPRYFFSNLSSEIRQIFRDACPALGVETTMSNARNVSVSHRRSVAILDELVGPKA